MEAGAKEGWLVKQGEKRKNWKKRYFVLSNSLRTIKYFASAKEKNAKGIILLDYATQVNPNKTQGKDNCFEIVSPSSNRTFYMVADSARMMNEWVGALNKAIEKLAFEHDCSDTSSAVFKVPLEVALKHHPTQSRVPYVLLSTAHYIAKYGINEEGILRVSGNSAEVQRLKDAFNSGRDFRIDTVTNDCHAVAGCLKLFLRELPEPILTFELYGEFIGAGLNDDQDLKRLVGMLPEVNKNTLRLLLSFLNTISKYQHINLMTSRNLAVVVGPNLLRPPGEVSLSAASDSATVVEVVKFLIENHSNLFG